MSCCLHASPLVARCAGRCCNGELRCAWALASVHIRSAAVRCRFLWPACGPPLGVSLCVCGCAVRARAGGGRQATTTYEGIKNAENERANGVASGGARAAAVEAAAAAAWLREELCAARVTDRREQRMRSGAMRWPLLGTAQAPCVPPSTLASCCLVVLWSVAAWSCPALHPLTRSDFSPPPPRCTFSTAPLGDGAFPSAHCRPSQLSRH